MTGKPPHHPEQLRYRWVVLGASFLVRFLVFGSLFAVGVLYVAWLDEFHMSKGDTAWIGSLATGSCLLVGPAACAIMTKIGTRRTLVLGGVLMSSGMILSVLAPNIYYLFFTYGILAGCGGGIANLAAVVRIVDYFDKERAFAMGVGSSGVGLGAFGFNVLEQYLLNEYGWRGSLLIIGGICLNICMAGLLMVHPKHLLKPRKKTVRKTEEITTSQPKTKLHEFSEDERDLIPFAEPSQDSGIGDLSRTSQTNHESDSRNNGPHKFLHTNHENDSRINEHHESIHVTDESISRNEGGSRTHVECERATLHESNSRTPLVNSSEGSQYDNGSPTSLKKGERDSRDDDFSRISAEKSKRDLLDKDFSRTSLEKGVRHSRDDFSRTSCRNHEDDSRNAHENPEGSPEEYEILIRTSKSFQLKANGTNSPNHIPHNKTKPPRRKSSIFQKFMYKMKFTDMTVSLWRDPLFILLFVSDFLSWMVQFVPYVHLPERARILGISSTQSALLVSSMGFAGAIGKLSFGIVCTYLNFDTYKIFTAAQILFGLSTLLSPLCESFATLLLYAISFGFLSGSYALMMVIPADLLGFEKFSAAYGFLLAGEGVGVYLGPPIAGWISDASQSYDNSFYCAGAVLLTSGLILLLRPCAERLRINKDEPV